MPPVYRVKDWDAIYETAETRKLENLRWVPTPNKHDGLGFRRIAQNRNRAELLSAWLLIVQVASKGRRGQRGILTRDGRPLDAEDLSLMTGFPAPIFAQALTFFSDPKQGWLLTDSQHEFSPSPASVGEQSHGSPGAPAESPAPPAESPAVEKGREEKGMEESDSFALDASAPDGALAAAEPPVMTFPCVGTQSEWGLSCAFADQLANLYPTIDTLAECRLALGKINAGAVSKKTAKGMSKFLFSWMDRASNGKRGTPQASASATNRRASFA